MDCFSSQLSDFLCENVCIERGAVSLSDLCVCVCVSYLSLGLWHHLLHLWMGTDKLIHGVCVSYISNGNKEKTQVNECMRPYND